LHASQGTFLQNNAIANHTTADDFGERDFGLTILGIKFFSDLDGKVILTKADEEQLPPVKLGRARNTTAVRAQTPSTAPATVKSPTPPRTPTSNGRSSPWPGAALFCGILLVGSSASEFSVSRYVGPHPSHRATLRAKILFSPLLIK